MEAYIVESLGRELARHERRIHDAGKRYSQHSQSTDAMVAAQAEGTFLSEMRDSIDDLKQEMSRRTPDPVIHALEFSDNTVAPTYAPYSDATARLPTRDISGG